MNVAKKIKKRELPDKENWTWHRVRVFAKTEDYETAKKWSKKAAVQSSVESSDDAPKRKKHPVCLSSSDEDHLLSLITQKIISMESEMKAMRSSIAALYELYARTLGDGTAQRMEEMNLDVCDSMEELLLLEEKLKEETFRNRVTHHLSLVGGPNPGENTRRVMRAVASYSVWKEFSLKGKKGKRPLQNMTIMKVIKKAVMMSNRGIQQAKVEDIVADTLKHAPASKHASLGPVWGHCGQPIVGPDTGVKCGAHVGPTVWGQCGAPVGQPKVWADCGLAHTMQSGPLLGPEVGPQQAP
ncbi:hypothetical protein DPX16_12590 [Anabarilius grahami]|uniref:Uncharacterized protein n=1 Tax=Anabarilius grahami TaxID=495550 RepID=A0A3N0YKK9_ANAGA|nr:hypothetical protein DPX16_12590 [Anabarilius grahami]